MTKKRMLSPISLPSNDERHIQQKVFVSSNIYTNFIARQKLADFREKLGISVAIPPPTWQRFIFIKDDFELVNKIK